LRVLHGKLINGATHCPQNFAHKASIVGAEIARLAGASGEAQAQSKRPNGRIAKGKT